MFLTPVMPFFGWPTTKSRVKSLLTRQSASPDGDPLGGASSTRRSRSFPGYRRLVNLTTARTAEGDLEHVTLRAWDRLSGDQENCLTALSGS